MAGTIRLKRVYDAPAGSDGVRFLVERLWPRGMKKEALRLDGWLRDVAPSTRLRQWFGHDPARWDEFQRRYRRELDANPAVTAPLLEAARRGAVTLLYSARDTEHNAAVALKAYLEERGAGRGAAARKGRC
jgi:uncharacterized protein YeaO (DUF488 family)